MKQAQAVFPEGQQSRFERLECSAAVQCGDFLLVSGQVGLKPDGTVEEHPRKQIILVFEKFRSLLIAVNLDFFDVVEIRSFHVRLEEYVEAYLAGMRRHFPDPPSPSYTGLIEVSCQGVLGLIVEVAVTAYTGARSR